MSGTQWVRVDVGYLTNPKVRRVGRDGALLHLSSILYAGGQGLDDGLLPPEALPILAPQAYIRVVDPVIERLVKCGLWHPDLSGGFLVHDFAGMNGADSEAAASRARQRRKRVRDRQRLEQYLDTEEA